MTETTQAADTAAMRARADQRKAAAREQSRAALDADREARQLEHEAKLIDNAAVALAALRQAESLVPGLEAAVLEAVADERAAEDRFRAEDRKLARVKSERAASDPRDGDAQDKFAVRIDARQGAVDACQLAVTRAHDAQVAAQEALDRRNQDVTALTAAYNEAKHKAENPGTAPGGSAFSPGVSGLSDMDENARDAIKALVLLGGLSFSSGTPPAPEGDSSDPSKPRYRHFPDGRTLVIQPPAGADERAAAGRVKVKPGVVSHAAPWQLRTAP